MSKEIEAFNRLIEESPEVHIESYNLVLTALQRLEAIDNANHSEVFEWINKYIDWYCEKIEELKNQDKGIADIYNNDNKMFVTIKQALLNSQEQEKENAKLKEILMNGFKDNDGVFHKQTYLAFVDDEWCICDLATDEWFLVKEVINNDRT